MSNRILSYPRFLLGIFLLLLCPGIVHGQIWSEEFDAGSQPDSSVWSYDTGSGGWGNNELQTYTNDPANVRVEGGNLIITAIASDSARGRPGSKSFTSARIKTEEKLTVLYGTIEARIMVPDLADGLWPAFWMLGSSSALVGWPDCGEIDIMEMGFESAITEGVVNRRIGSTAHWEYQNNYAGYGLTLDANSDLNGSWHIYRMEWTPTMITTFIDNTQIWAFDISDPASFDGEEFHQPYFFILNLAVGGSFTGLFGSTDITAPMPAEMRVDYVRIYDNGYTVLGGSSIGGGNPPPAGGTEAHVASIVPGKQGGGPNASASATIAIVDENGNPVAGAEVTATFSGSHNQTLTGATGSDGLVTITTTETNRNVAFTVCVDDVSSTLVYDPAANVETCDSY